MLRAEAQRENLQRVTEVVICPKRNQCCSQLSHLCYVFKKMLGLASIGWVDDPVSHWMMSLRQVIIVAVIIIATSMAAQEPKELRDARHQFESLKHASEADRVRYITRLVRLRESFTRADAEIMHTIDAEVLRHPMPATAESQALVQRLVGRWQSPRRPYFYHRDGTWASNEDTPENTGGTWRIEGNEFFQNYRGQPASSGETIILLTTTDFVYGAAPYYLRRGTAFPWRD